MLESAFKNIYCIFTAVLAAVVLGGTAVVAVFYNINALHIIISVAVWALLFLIMHKYSGNKAVVLGVVLAGVILRVLYALFCTQMPESDFKLYYDMAASFAKGKYNISAYAKMFPHVLGYSSALGAWFKLFGTSLVSARMLNVVFDVFTTIFLYITANRISDKRVAGFTMFLFSLSPSVILYSGLVCTEKASVMFITIFLCIITFIVKKPAIASVLCSIVSAVANVIRPNGVILLITLVLVCITLLKTKKKYLYVLLAMVVYFTASASINAVISNCFGEVAHNPTGWNLYVGLNTGSFGQWNDSDAAQLDVIMNEKSADEAHKILRGMAKERLKENSAVENLALICSKFGVMWSNDIAVCSYLKDDRIYKTMYNSFSAEAIISGFYTVFALTSLYCALLYLKKKKTYIPAMLIVMGTAAMHLLSEVMGRYAYPGIICMFLLCGSVTQKNIYFLGKKY